MGIKVILVTGNYLPGKKGGIENYVHELAKLLIENHLVVQVAAMNLNEKQAYCYDGVTINYLDNSFDAFKNLLQEGRFDICHFHEYSAYGGIELPWFLKAKDFCKQVYFTFHLPYLTCYKTDFRYLGYQDCNTFTSVERCMDCVLSEKVSVNLNNILPPQSSVIRTVSKVLAGTFYGSRLRKNIKVQNASLSQLVEICDKIFIVADWFKDVLASNGYAGSNIKKISFPGTFGLESNLEFSGQVKGKIVYAGRIERVKGLHLLCHAMNKINVENLELDVYGNISSKNYYNKCMNIYDFNYKGVRRRDELLDLFNCYDFMIVPSVWAEMYSMVMQESFRKRLPVIASDTLRHREVIKDSVNGFLFEYDNAKDLAAIIDKAYKLKKKGWQPVFTYAINPEKDIEEIITYYK